MMTMVMMAVSILAMTYRYFCRSRKTERPRDAEQLHTNVWQLFEAGGEERGGDSGQTRTRDRASRGGS